MESIVRCLIRIIIPVTMMAAHIVDDCMPENVHILLSGLMFIDASIWLIVWNTLYNMMNGSWVYYTRIIVNIIYGIFVGQMLSECIRHVLRACVSLFQKKTVCCICKRMSLPYVMTQPCECKDVYAHRECILDMDKSLRCTECIQIYRYKGVVDWITGRTFQFLIMAALEVACIQFIRYFEPLCRMDFKPSYMIPFYTFIGFNIWLWTEYIMMHVTSRYGVLAEDFIMLSMVLICVYL